MNILLFLSLLKMFLKSFKFGEFFGATRHQSKNTHIQNLSVIRTLSNYKI